MKLKDAREHYYFYSGKTSDLVRQLGLAGIAVIWLFKSDVQGIPKISLSDLSMSSTVILHLWCAARQRLHAGELLRTRWKTDVFQPAI